jgi:hypothetical protein
MEILVIRETDDTIIDGDALELDVVYDGWYEHNTGGDV